MKSASAKQQRTLVPIAVSEALDKLAHGRGIARHGPRPVVDWGLGDSGGGEQQRADVVKQRHAKPVA
jgi:hypothetical protein